jgi:rhodanese-related sulfurtransferase
VNNSMSPALCALLWAAWFFAVLGYFWWRDTLHPGRIHELLKSGALLVDAATPEQYATDHAPSAVNIPANDIRRRRDELGGHTSAVLVYARSAFRSAAAAHILRAIGFDTVVNIGTLGRWRAAQTSASAESANHRLGYEAFGATPCIFVGAILGARAGLLGALAAALVGGIAGAAAGVFFDAKLSARAARMRKLDARPLDPSSRSVVRQVHATEVSEARTIA